MNLGTGKTEVRLVKVLFQSVAKTVGGDLVRPIQVSLGKRPKIDVVRCTVQTNLIGLMGGIFVRDTIYIL